MFVIYIIGILLCCLYRGSMYVYVYTYVYIIFYVSRYCYCCCTGIFLQNIAPPLEPSTGDSLHGRCRYCCTHITLPLRYLSLTFMILLYVCLRNIAAPPPPRTDYCCTGVHLRPSYPLPVYLWNTHTHTQRKKISVLTSLPPPV